MIVWFLGVKTVCGICFDYEPNEALLITNKCLYPKAHKSPSICVVAWDAKKRKVVQINPRPHLSSMKGQFQLCDPIQHQKRKHCTYAHSESELNAWNYDLSKERERQSTGIMTSNDHYKI